MAGLLSVAYLAPLVWELLSEVFKTLSARPKGKDKDMSDESDSEVIASPLPAADERQLKAEAEQFFRHKFGPGSFDKYARDEEYRRELDGILQKFIKRAQGDRDGETSPQDKK